MNKLALSFFVFLILAPDAIVIQPADITILSRGVQDANSKNIPVFVYDQYIVNAKMTSFIKSFKNRAL